MIIRFCKNCGEELVQMGDKEWLCPNRKCEDYNKVKKITESLFEVKK